MENHPVYKWKKFIQGYGFVKRGGTKMENSLCVYCHNTGRRPLLKKELKKIIKPLRDKSYVKVLTSGYLRDGTIPCNKCIRGEFDAQ